MKNSRNKNKKKVLLIYAFSFSKKIKKRDSLIAFSYSHKKGSCMRFQIVIYSINKSENIHTHT